jgi:hypothetical protein
LAPHFAPQDLSAERQRVRYSDTNYMLLCAVIETVTGETLPVVHERLLMRPLNLRHTYFAGRSQPFEPTPPPPPLRVEGRPIDIPLLLRSIWAMYSTAADTLMLLRSLIGGEVFETPTTLASMQQRWNRFGLPFDRAALRSPGWPIEYGLGIMRFRLPWIFTPLHPMPAVVGHTGSTGCWLFYQYDVSDNQDHHGHDCGRDQRKLRRGISVEIPAFAQGLYHAADREGIVQNNGAVQITAKKEEEPGCDALRGRSASPRHRAGVYGGARHGDDLSSAGRGRRPDVATAGRSR